VLPNTLQLALFTAAVFGFRHGFDYDHIAAITDITSVEPSRSRGMRMGFLYVLGHAATVAVLGAAVIFFQRSLPAKIDNWAERAVGLTLVLLGIYVLGTMLREKSSYAPKSRASMLIGAFRWLAWKARGVFGAPRASKPQARSGSYSGRSVFLIGIIHGLGAETPTQLMIFLLAANLGGVGLGFLGLGMFLAGLVTMNMLMTASAVGLFGATSAKPRLMRLVLGLTAAYSVVVGTIFLFGSSALLPPLGG
jgi:high-affinity nickel permease